MRHQNTPPALALPRSAAQAGLIERPATFAARLRALVPAEVSARSGRLALAAIALGALVAVVFASAGSSILVPRSMATYPSWEAGPLGGLFGQLAPSAGLARIGYSVLVVGMMGAYGLALLAARSLSIRTIWVFVVGTALILVLGPPLQLNDVWNYLGYARLGALHHLNPYTVTMRAESNDPIYTFVTWPNYASPYGPLFTAITYPLAFVPIPIAYWLIKLGIVAVALAFVWTVGWCARLLGRDPRFAILLIAANPVYVFYAVGGFHNDFLMLLPATAAIGLLLDRRDTLSGAALMLAVAVKPTAIVLLPFLLIAARPPQRRPRVLAGFLLTGIPLLILSLALFGLAMPNIASQSSMMTAFSFPNLTGLALGIGGSTTMIVRLANLGLVAVVLWGLRRREWLTGAGWATFALIASVSWLMPWYVIWLLPLAALAQSRALRRTALALTLFLVIAFVPSTVTLLNAIGIRPMGSAIDQAALAYQARLQAR
jgi:alpha-1,6-mannosyltransferase